MKTTLEGTKSRLDDAEENAGDLEDRLVEITQPGQQKEWRLLKELWDNIKLTNTCITAVPEGEEKDEGTASPRGAIMTENILNLVKKTGIQVQDAQGAPNKKKPKETHTKTRHHQNVEI